MLQIHKITEYKNASGVTRVMVTAIKETAILAGLASTKEFGSIVLLEGTTLVQAEKAFTVGDDMPDVKFGAINDDGFYRIVAK